MYRTPALRGSEKNKAAAFFGVLWFGNKPLFRDKWALLPNAIAHLSPRLHVIGIFLPALAHGGHQQGYNFLPLPLIRLNPCRNVGNGKNFTTAGGWILALLIVCPIFQLPRQTADCRNIRAFFRGGT